MRVLDPQQEGYRFKSRLLDAIYTYNLNTFCVTISLESMELNVAESSSVKL